MRYQDVYPSEALLRSSDVARPRAAELLSLEFFEAAPASMPAAVFEQHHLLCNLRAASMRVENWRGKAHRDFTFRPNEIILTPAGVKSGWHWHEQSQVIVITIMPERMAKFATTELGVLLSDRQLLDTPQQLDPDLCQSAMMLLDALRSRSTGSEVMYESLARIFLVKLIQRYGDMRTEALQFSQGFTASHYKRVLDYVTDHYGDPITVEDMGRIAALSTAHFSRLFKEVLGDSPYQFLMNYRIEQAKVRLGDRTQAISDIALRCGFADQPHFSRIFRKLTGETPKAYREAQ
ncbi:MAG: AraC family transcriptional regulator [Erythrobacter sp.]|uniref:helix-turn-helix domain-containing protein n=1 Tax=Erythrobacter sp. TaxID=1042 RepID=UPI0025F45C11|nr:AraC family transcriptional regulator [Erythrobacter sp.]MCM0000589.1 AraC family transcriptional regulator [Erythrobacter sp.]